MNWAWDKSQTRERGPVTMHCAVPIVMRRAWAPRLCNAQLKEAWRTEMRSQWRQWARAKGKDTRRRIRVFLDAKVGWASMHCIVPIDKGKSCFSQSIQEYWYAVSPSMDLCAEVDYDVVAHSDIQCVQSFIVLLICFFESCVDYVMWISVLHEYIMTSNYVHGRTIKSLVTLQHLVSLLSIFLVLVTYFGRWSFDRKYDLPIRRVLVKPWTHV